MVSSYPHSKAIQAFLIKSMYQILQTIPPSTVSSNMPIQQLS